MDPQPLAADADILDTQLGCIQVAGILDEHVAPMLGVCLIISDPRKSTALPCLEDDTVFVRLTGIGPRHTTQHATEHGIFQAVLKKAASKALRFKGESLDLTSFKAVSKFSWKQLPSNSGCFRLWPSLISCARRCF